MTAEMMRFETVSSKPVMSLNVNIPVYTMIFWGGFAKAISSHENDLPCSDGSGRVRKHFGVRLPAVGEGIRSVHASSRPVRRAGPAGAPTPPLCRPFRGPVGRPESASQ